MRALVVSCEYRNVLLTLHKLDRGLAAAHFPMTRRTIDQYLTKQPVKMDEESTQEAA